MRCILFHTQHSNNLYSNRIDKNLPENKKNKEREEKMNKYFDWNE